jgi:arabinose-5-phosphate isomerase
MARRRGAKIVAQTEAPTSPLGKRSDIVLCVSAPEDVDPFGLVATGSSLVGGAVGDAICILLLELSGYSREAFGATHPGGAVGRQLAGEKQPEEANR